MRDSLHIQDALKDFSKNPKNTSHVFYRNMKTALERAKTTGNPPDANAFNFTLQAKNFGTLG